MEEQKPKYVLTPEQKRHARKRREKRWREEARREREIKRANRRADGPGCAFWLGIGVLWALLELL